VEVVATRSYLGLELREKPKRKSKGSIKWGRDFSGLCCIEVAQDRFHCRASVVKMLTLPVVLPDSVKMSGLGHFLLRHTVVMYSARRC